MAIDRIISETGLPCLLERLVGVFSGLLGAISYSLTVVLLAGPLHSLDRFTYKAMAVIVGLALSPALWAFLKGAVQKTEIVYDWAYILFLVAGMSVQSDIYIYLSPNAQNGIIKELVLLSMVE